MLNRNGTKKLAEIVRVILEDIDKRDLKEEAEDEDCGGYGANGNCADNAGVGEVSEWRDAEPPSGIMPGTGMADQEPASPGSARQVAGQEERKAAIAAFEQAIEDPTLKQAIEGLSVDKLEALKQAIEGLSVDKIMKILGRTPTDEAHDDDASRPALTREALRNIMQEEYRNVMEAYRPDTPTGLTPYQLRRKTKRAANARGTPYSLTISGDEAGTADTTADTQYWIEDYEGEEWIDILGRLLIQNKLTPGTGNSLDLLMRAKRKLRDGQELEQEDIDVIEDSHPTKGRTDENQFSESKKLTRSMLKTILQEEYRNVVEAGEEEGIVTGVEDVLRLEELLEWFEGRSFGERQAWAETLADTDVYPTGKERVKVGVALGLGVKDLDTLANVELDSGMIAFVLKQAG